MCSQPLSCGPVLLRGNCSTSLLLMPWLCVLPDHRQPWYYLRIMNRSVLSTISEINFLCSEVNEIRTRLSSDTCGIVCQYFHATKFIFLKCVETASSVIINHGKNHLNFKLFKHHKVLTRVHFLCFVLIKLSLVKFIRMIFSHLQW